MKLKSWTLALTLAFATVARAATNDLTGLLQKGLFEEEANRDLTAAIANYQTLASAFDKDRQLAATAIFRLGECYRKLGKTNEAVVQYQRIIKEFSDQQTLVTLSQQNLSGLRPTSTTDSNAGPSLDDLHLALIQAQKLVRSVDGTIEAAHGTNRGPVLIHLFQQDKSLQLLIDDQQALRARQKELLKTYLPDNTQVKDLNELIQAKQKAMEDRADELAAAAHRSLDLAQKAYDQKLAELGSGASSSANSTHDSELAQAETTAASLQVQIDEITKMPHDQARIFVQQNYPNPVLTQLMTELDLAQQNLIALQINYAPDHPKIQNAKEMVADLNFKVDAQVEGVVTGLRSKLAVAQVQLNLQRKRQNEMAGTTGGGGGSQDSATTDEEQTQIRNIQAMIQNSPDLINAPNADGMTPLLLAAEKGQLVVAKYLLDHGADVNGLSRNHGDVPLAIAAGNGHKAMVELLLARGAEVNGRGLNPLYEAVNRGYVAVAEVLLANKADVNLRSGTDTSGARPIHRAVMGDNVELIQLLISHGADVNVTNAEGRTPLEFAAMQNQTNSARLLLAAKASVEAKDNQGNTALHEAARAGNAGMVSLLLDSGAAVEPINRDDTAPLLLAVAARQTDATRVLLEHKADPNREGWGLQSPNAVKRALPVDFAIWKDSNDILKLLLDAGANPEGNQTSRIPLFAAMDRNAVDAVKLLLEHRADPNHVENGWPALNYAVVNRKDNAIIALLLDKGADPNARDAEGFPPLFRTHDAEIAGQLIAHKADVNARSKSGGTALMQVWGGPTNYLKVLLQSGANVDLQDTIGNTALHSAVWFAQPGVGAVLLEGKANPNIQNNQGYTPLDLAKNGANGQIMGGMFAASYGQKDFNSIEEKKTEQKLADLLANAGGLANLPKRDRIEVRRASNRVYEVLKDPQGRNRFSLFEVIASAYGLLSQKAYGDWNAKTEKMDSRQNLFPATLRFPDFKNVIIYRRTGAGTKQTVINVDVDEILKTGDCSRDSWLEWGDIVEVPEADHPVDQTWSGLSNQDVTSLLKCVSRQVTIKIKGENTSLKLAPEIKPVELTVGDRAYGGTRLTTASFMLRSVLDNSKLIRVSSDLARVKVTRTDPAAKKTTDWIVDCADNNPPALWLRDGDVIEVPEK